MLSRKTHTCRKLTRTSAPNCSIKMLLCQRRIVLAILTFQLFPEHFEQYMLNTKNVTFSMQMAQAKVFQGSRNTLVLGFLGYLT